MEFFELGYLPLNILFMGFIHYMGGYSPVFHQTNMPKFICPSHCSWLLGVFLVWGCYEQCCREHCYTLVYMCMPFSREHTPPPKETAESWGMFIFDFTKEWSTIFKRVVPLVAPISCGRSSCCTFCILKDRL